MNSMHALRFVTSIIACAFALALPAGAQAVTIGFDDLPAGTVLTNQYAGAGGPGQGVVFGPLPGGAGDGIRPRIAGVGLVMANSGKQVASIAHCTCEFFIPNTTGSFQTPRNSVSVRTGLTGSAEPAVVTLTAYNSAGMVVGTPASASVGPGVKTKLEVSTPSATIVGFRLAARDAQDTNKPVAIDDLTFDTAAATPPPEPDFALTATPGFVALTEGRSVTVDIAISRFGGSSGPVDLAAAGLPEGVAATLEPDPAPGSESTLTLAAAPGAPATVDQPPAVTVTGSPGSPGTGPGPRTTSVSVQVRAAFELLAPATVALEPCAASVPIRIARAADFTDPVELTLTGGGPGLSATLTDGELSVTGDPTGRPLGPVTYTVTGRAAGLPDRSVAVTVSGTCPASYDARVTSMQITQGVQSPVLPLRNATNPLGRFNYADLAPAMLVRDRATVVRVYANLRTGPVEGVRHVPALLHATVTDAHGREHTLPGSPLLSLGGLRTLALGPTAPTAAEQAGETSAYTFVLPPVWTRQSNELEVRAQLLPGLNIGKGARRVAACETPLCRANDGMTLRRMPFVPLPEVTIRPVRMSDDSQEAAFPQPQDVFSAMRQTVPFPLRIEPYYGRIDITGAYNPADNNSTALLSDLRDYMCDHSLPGTGWMVGVNTDYAAGVQGDDQVCYAPPRLPEIAVVEYGRPLSSSGHEIGHLFGLNHASGGCDASLEDSPYDDWPPDQRGLTQSVGLDLRQGSGRAGGPFEITSPPGTTSVFDQMSYCGANSVAAATLFREPDKWTSVRNWNKMFDKAGDLDRRASLVPRQSGVAVPSLAVAGSGAGATAAIERVTPVDALPADGGSPFRLLGFDASGIKVADVGMRESRNHVHGGTSSTLSGVLPAAGVVRVAIARDGQVLAERSASAARPEVALRGTPRFAGAGATVSWTTSDGDGDALTASLAYSAGGRFERVWMGTDSSVRLPARLLPRARSARLRVTVSDGFHTATATSKPFRSPGAVPSVRILSPIGGARQSGDAGLVLRGEAFDDAGRSLSGRRLVWRDGRRVLGRGAAVIAHGVRSGDVSLTATDRFGRSSRARVRVKMHPAPAFLTTLRAVGRRGRSVRLRVAASRPGTLRVRGRRYDVGRTTRTILVRVGRAKSARLVLRLGATTRTLTVPR